MTANAISSPTLKASAPLYQSLFVQVLAALLLGIQCVLRDHLYQLALSEK